ncbi:MAG: flippase-like domain-containing protein [Candidatus Eisenbacteria bacterium]
MLEHSKVRRAAFIFLIGSLAILAATLLVTTDEETWWGVASFGGVLIAALFGIVLLRMVLEGLGLLVLVNGTQEAKLSVLESLELTLEGYFIAQLIPVSAAGVPYQGFLLTRKGVRPGWATAVVLVKGFIPGVFFFFILVGVAVAALFGWEGSGESLTFLKIVGPIALLPTGTVMAMLVIVATRPALFDRLVDRIAAFLSRNLRGRAAQRVDQARVLIAEESHVFRDALTTMRRERRWVLLWGVVLVALAYVVEFTLGVVILWGFGYHGSAVGPIVLQGVLKPIIAASPTPGSLAIGEGGYIGFFAAYLPAHFVGVSLVLWRIMLYFIPMFVGGTLVAKRIGRAQFAAAVSTSAQETRHERESP